MYVKVFLATACKFGDFSFRPLNLEDGYSQNTY